jgi:23S rRNA pseudouridine1911/1915/1917 synthase
VANWIIAAYPETASVGEDPLRPGIVHRLDRETSGVMMIAKTKKGFDELKHVFHDRLAEKTYIALVFGHMPELTGIIDRPIGQRSGELRRRSGSNLPENAREAMTTYRVIARYKDCDLIIATPKTGRTHQIRVHMAALGHPIIGDTLYASKPMRQPKALSAPRHMLHAWRLSLPLFGQKASFQAPLPIDFKDVLSGVDPGTYFDADLCQQITESR